MESCDYYWIWFSSIRTLSAYKKKLLIENGLKPYDLFHMKPDEFTKIKYLTPENVYGLAHTELRENAKRLEDHICRNKIGIIKYHDAKYPLNLKNIYDPPAVLYSRGNMKDLKSAGIVGSRASTPYGDNIAQSIAYYTAKAGYGIVSGLAKGVDSFAHKGALKAYGYTIAVLGSGIDVCYPKENLALMEKICESGLVLSEYAPGSAPERRNFPERNRIISGLSDAVIVVEARMKSGSLITVEFALEQGREVFAVPGNINSPNSDGTNLLIKDGARLILNPEDFLREFESII